MKKFNFVSVMIIFIYSNCISQVTQDYPFKTYLDSANNLYTAGYIDNNGHKNIYIQKFNSGGNPFWDRQIINTNGDDRGLDLIVDRFGKSYVTGYIFNIETNSNDIFTLCLDVLGNIIWNSIYYNPGDDKGMGIDLIFNDFGEASEVIITGYITSQNSTKDFIVKKYDAEDGAPLAQYVSSIGVGDDVATDILIDKGFVYVSGYSFQGRQRLNDIVIQVFGKQNLDLQETLIDCLPGSDEKPTEFLIAGFSNDILMKSRVSLTSVTEGFSVGNNGRKFLTMYIEPDGQNLMNVRWRKEFSNCSNCRTDAATSIAKDLAGDIYVSGYAFNYDNSFQSNGIDFATIKYNAWTGNYGWTGGARFFNFSETSATGVDDKASSVKVNQFKDVYVAGPSDGSPNGFSIVKYSQPSGHINYEYDRSFIPNFINDERTGDRNLSKWATLQLSSDGTPLMVVMGWNSTEAHWAAVKFDANGNVLYTINNNTGGMNPGSLSKGDNEAVISNYPNPFNPSTVIRYSLSDNSFVSIKVYNSLGKEIAEPVSGSRNSGTHTALFSGSSLPSGVYYYTISLNGIVKETKSMMLLK